MALSAAAVGRVPVDVAAALALDGVRVIENIGARPLRFAVAEAPGELPPADPRDGHLLQPGRRETVRTAAGTPVWAWAPHPTRLGVGPAWRVAAGLGGGGGLSLLFAGRQVDGALDGAHAAGATVLTVGDAAVYRLGRVQVAGELHTIEGIDEAARTLTIEAAGLTADQADDAQVVQAPILGADDVLQLPEPAGEYSEIDVRFLYDLPQLNGNPPFYNGRSSGAFYSGEAQRSAYFETLSNFSYWWANGQVEDDPSGTWSVGLIHATGGLGNAWSIEFDPATHRLLLRPLDASLAMSFIPRIYNLIVAGRAA